MRNAIIILSQRKADEMLEGYEGKQNSNKKQKTGMEDDSNRKDLSTPERKVRNWEQDLVTAVQQQSVVQLRQVCLTLSGLFFLCFVFVVQLQHIIWAIALFFFVFCFSGIFLSPYMCVRSYGMTTLG
jgi:hypothetical protein